MVDLGDRMVPRTGALVSPVDGVIRPGVELVFDWSSAADRSGGDLALYLGLPGDGPYAVDGPLVPTVRGDQLVVDAPVTLPAIGDGQALLMLRDQWNGAVPLPCAEAACLVLGRVELILPIRYAR